MKRKYKILTNIRVSFLTYIDNKKIKVSQINLGKKILLLLVDKNLIQTENGGGESKEKA